MSDIPKHVDEYLNLGKSAGASDVHLSVSSPPTCRRYGQLLPLWQDAPLLKAEDTEALVAGFLDEQQSEQLKRRGDVDFAYSNTMGRYRTSVVRQRLGLDLAFRIINSEILTLDQLGMPPQLKLLTQYQNGLVLVTGPIGSGKTTTLAALVQEINLHRNDHIITLEEPIEYLIPSAGCQVTQREVHTHTKSFAAALRGALREDPDVIMVGEMRDLETIQLAISASETGHLVLGTLHTSNSSRTLDRLLDVFPPDQRDQIRVMVSESLRGIISQQLIPRADGNGRAVAMEILMNSPAVANVIRESKTFMLPGIIQTGKKTGMVLMDDSVAELYSQGIITTQEAVYRAENKPQMRTLCGV
ncbi:MAG: PilT/PilU family type 4a pilus ATPase [Verrucomicrobia bacterium]|jgi:twitching motility protein PilT|nr:MAG: PilT/PilU family type 4a pilus ATPase [Verrucomicrobiota bacterium]